MRFKLDENLSRHLKQPLSEIGHDVLTVADEALLSCSDEQVAAAARREDRVVLTLDVGFADLRKYPPGTHPGVIVFRPPSLGPLEVNRFVEAGIRSLDLPRLAGCVAVVDAHHVRVRSPERRG